jgi:hypothetical protein
LWDTRHSLDLAATCRWRPLRSRPCTARHGGIGVGGREGGSPKSVFEGIGRIRGRRF